LERRAVEGLAGGNRIHFRRRLAPRGMARHALSPPGPDRDPR
jgi:hypothetical protein